MTKKYKNSNNNFMPEAGQTPLAENNVKMI